mgnify:CR=1 FL=1
MGQKRATMGQKINYNDNGGSMARTKAENEAIARKIAVFKREGLREDRAVAAAFRYFREGKLKIKPSKPKKKKKIAAITAAIIAKKRRNSTAKRIKPKTTTRTYRKR